MNWPIRVRLSALSLRRVGPMNPRIFWPGGLVSFSDAFFGGVMRGDDVEQAWLAASNAMAGYQNACWDDDGGAATMAIWGLRLWRARIFPRLEA